MDAGVETVQSDEEEEESGYLNDMKRSCAENLQAQKPRQEYCRW